MLAKGDLKYWAIERACGKHDPESALKMGHAFRLKCQRKARPGIYAQTGMQFPDGRLAETMSQNSPSKRDAVSGWALRGKLHPGIDVQSGTHFPVELSNGNRIPESALKAGRAFPGAASSPNLSQLYIDLNRFAENCNSPSTCAFANLNSWQ